MARTLSEAEFNAIKESLLQSAPPGMTEAEFDRWFTPRFDGAIAEAEQQPEGSAVRRFAANAAETLNPLTALQGLWSLVSTNPVTTATNIYRAQAGQANKAREAFGRGDYGQAVGHGIASAVPLVGPAAAEAGEQIASGDVAGGLGRAAGMLVPVASARPLARAGARAVGDASRKLVRSAIKPTVASARAQAGASLTGLDAQARKLADFIADNGITTRDKAQAIVQAAEAEIQAVAKNTATMTDEPARAQRYLQALERSAKRQRLPATDVATIRNAMAELMEGSLGQDVVTMVPKPHPTLLDASGQPITVLVPETTRALRAGTPVSEALDSARASSKWKTRKAWGEMKGTEKEVSKAVERAGRDAAKTAAPELKPLLGRQGQAIEARNVLDRMQFREGNLEPVSPFDVTTAAVELGTGNVPVLSAARHFLRGNKLKMGVWGRRLEKAILDHDEAAAAAILDRYGVIRDVGATSPSGSQTPTTTPAWQAP